jgi:hypothetical protein
VIDFGGFGMVIGDELDAVGAAEFETGRIGRGYKRGELAGQRIDLSNALPTEA